MAAKKSLADSMQFFEKTAPTVTLQPAKKIKVVEEGSNRPPSRVGKRAITGYFSQDAFTQFKILAAERNTDGQALVEEAINDLFKKYNKPPIA